LVFYEAIPVIGILPCSIAAFLQNDKAEQVLDMTEEFREDSGRVLSKERTNSQEWRWENVAAALSGVPDEADVALSRAP